MTAVMHIYLSHLDPRSARVKGTFGYAKWLSDRGFRGYRLGGSIHVARRFVADIEAVASHEGWLVRVHDDNDGGSAA